MSDGRVFRKVEERWEPIGDPLPAWDHVPPRPRQPINVWVLPKGEGYRAGDVIAFGETGHRLLSLVPADDVAVERSDRGRLDHEFASPCERVGASDRTLVGNEIRGLLVMSPVRH